jgi:ribonuclease Z
MSLQIIFLGTSGAIPTNERSLPATLVQRGREMIMFECGEGVQRQMIRAKAGFHKRMKIFLSHLHGDHVLGLPGLLQTMALMDRKLKLEIYGPEGTNAFLECIRGSLQFGLTFPVEIYEILEAGQVCDEPEYVIETTKSNHVIPSYAYAFVEKSRPGRFYPEKAIALGVPEGELWSRLQHGKRVTLANGKMIKPQEVTGHPRRGRKIVFSGDTRPFRDFPKFASSADLLIHDSTFDDSLSDKAEEDGHSTPSQAGQLAKASKAKRLVLTHISARYVDSSLLLEQARKVFAETVVATDFMVLELPLAE